MTNHELSDIIQSERIFWAHRLLRAMAKELALQNKHCNPTDVEAAFDFAKGILVMDVSPTMFLLEWNDIESNKGRT
jgi:hypothetical protein